MERQLHLQGHKSRDPSRIRKQLHNTGLALPHQVFRTTTRTITDPFHFEAPPEEDDKQNGKEGRICGRLSSFQ